MPACLRAYIPTCQLGAYVRCTMEVYYVIWGNGLLSQEIEIFIYLSLFISRCITMYVVND